jgi:hypothetical protein
LRLNNYITDDISTGSNTKEQMEIFEDALQNIKKYNLWNSQVVLRGFNKKPSSGIIHKVTNERTGFKGKLSEKVQKVIELLDLPSAPVFTTKESHNAKFFGPVNVFIPDGDFISYINPTVQDLMFLQDSGPSAEDLAEGYVKFHNKIPKTNDYQEVIITCKSYYLVYPPQMIRLSAKSKYSTIKSPDDIKTYSDLIKLYNEWVSYMTWFIKTRLGENPNLLDYYKKDYPLEWFNEIK